MRHVPILGDDLQALNRLRVAYYVLKVDGPVFFYPSSTVRWVWE